MREAVAKICARFPDDYWRARDRDGVFPHELHKALAADGWLGIAMPEAYGGSGLGITEAALMMQTVAESGQLAQLIVIYGIGYVAVFVVLILMYLYALRKRHVLHLTRLDLFDARYAIEANVINIGTGLGSIALALLGAPPAVAGFFYLVLGPLRAVHGARSGRRRRGLERA